MLELETKKQLLLPAKIEKKKEHSNNPIIFYSPDKNNGEEKNDRAFSFQGNSGRIFINEISYTVLSFSKKMKKVMHGIKQGLSWKTENISHFLKNENLWKYIPAKVFFLSASCAVVAIFMIDTGIMSEVVYGAQGSREAYSAVSEISEGNVIIKKVGKELEDRNLAVVISKQCENDSAVSQDSEMCGTDVKNKVLADAEIREEQVRIAAARARELASHVSTAHVSCAEKNDGNPSKSETKGKHMDEDCCPDPDEWPKPGCIYSPHGYALMLSGPSRKK